MHPSVTERPSGTPGSSATPRPTEKEADVAEVAAAIGDASRIKVLYALADGGVLPASALAAEAGVSASTISGHLAKLRQAKLLTVEHDGRHRYYRLASTDVARVLEELARIAQPLPIRSLRDSIRTHGLLRARLCYDHLAGRLGVALLAALMDSGVLTLTAGSYRITPSGLTILEGFGVATDEFSRRRPAIRYCIDWGENRHHLAGALGAAIATRLFELGWLRRGRARRVVILTEDGETGLNKTFGLPHDWDTPRQTD
jgi:DNA-binding transcriptional ArsR family regulator